MASLLWVVLLMYISSFTSVTAAESMRKELRGKRANLKASVLKVHSLRSRRVDPSRVVSISWQPRVFVYRGLISDEECDYIISLGLKTKENADSSNKTGTIDVKDEVLLAIEERIAAWSVLPFENSKPLHVMHFASEAAMEKYHYAPNTSFPASSQPLMATILLYLSNVPQGGDIFFPNSKLRNNELKSERESWLRPTKGNAVLFFNVHVNASVDANAVHERRPVVDGEMWCAIKFFHLRPVVVSDKEEVWFSLEDDGDCTDQIDNCPQWAAMGECERNPVFMVGSPDYYGTCRKSCKVC